MRLAIIILTILTAGPLMAQDGSFRFGFKTSPGLSWMNSNDNKINSNGMNLAFKLGAIGEYHFSDQYSFATGLGFGFNHGGTLLYDQGGNLLEQSSLSEQSLHSLPDGVNIKYALQYIEIPVSFKMRTQEIGYWRYYVEIPTFTFSFNTKARADIEGEGVETEDENINEDIIIGTTSWGLGAGAEYSISTTTALVGGIHFQRSFIDVKKDGTKADGSAEDSKSTFGVISLRLGVIF